MKLDDGDSGRGRNRDPGRRGGAGGEGGRRAGARDPRDHHRGAADGDSRQHRRGRLRDVDRRHAPAHARGPPGGRRRSPSARESTPTRSRSPPSRRPASRRSPSPRSRRRPSSSARRARCPRARRLPRARPRRRARPPSRARNPKGSSGPALLVRLRRGRAAMEAGGSSADQRLLVVGLGNPGGRYDGTRHNVGFEVADELERRWELLQPKERYRGLIAEGRARPGGPRVAVLRPQTYMNESANSAGPARGALRVPLENTDRRPRRDRPAVRRGPQPSSAAGWRGTTACKSLEPGLRRRPDFWRVRVGVGRPRLDRPGRRLRLRPRALQRAATTRSASSSSAPPTRPSAWSSGSPAEDADPPR